MKRTERKIIHFNTHRIRPLTVIRGMAAKHVNSAPGTEITGRQARFKMKTSEQMIKDELEMME